MGIERKYRFSITDAFICTMYGKLQKGQNIASIEEVYYTAHRMIKLLENGGYKVRDKLNPIDLNAFLYQYKDYVDYDPTTGMFKLREFAKKDFVEIFNVERFPIEILDGIGFKAPHSF